LLISKVVAFLKYLFRFFQIYAEDVAVENIEKVNELICLQESQPGTSRSTLKIAAELHIHRSFVQQIAKHDVRLTELAISQHNLEHCRKLLQRMPKIQRRCYSLTRKTFIY